MTTPQERIKALMTSLDNTSLHGIAALDEAVRACSSFSSAQNWLDSFLEDCQAAMDSGCTVEQMANIVCGLVRNNDTGAISGLDAGSGVEKTAESIVPEDSDASAAVMPALGSTATIDGLQVTWPTQEELTAVISNGANASSVYFALKGLNTWWIHEAIKLGTSSYGLSFTEPDTTINVIKVNMMYDDTGDYKNSLAWVSWSYYTETGVTADMSLNINMHYYNDLLTSNPNGYAPEYKQEYLDRTLAHEFIHALMVSNMNYMSKLPLIFKEGIAELIHGIDDARGYAMSALANDLTMLKSALDLNASIPYEKYYAAGYMALRYLAKKDSIAPFVPNTAAWYDDNNTTLVVQAGSAYLNGAEGTQYLSTVIKIDASGSTTNKNVLVGNSNDDMIIAGSGTSSLWGGGSSSDTLQGGSGADTFFFGTGDGTDTITNYDAQKDTVDIYSNNISYGFVTGSDAVFHTPDSVLTLKDAAGGRVNIVYQNGTKYNIWLGLEKDNTLQYDSSLNYYYGAKNHKDTLTVAGDAAIWMNNSTSTTYENIDNLDASSSTGSVTLAGSTGSNLIIGSQGSSTLWGGYGQDSDTLQGGSGADTFFFASGEGTDTITDYDPQKDTIDIYSNNISYGFVTGSDAVFHTPDSVLTLKDAAGGRVNIVYQNGTNYNIWLGLEKDNTIQYDSSLNYYYGAKNHKDTLTIAGDAAIWMNNSTSTTYENIDNLDASSSTGSVILAGSTGSNLIIGSQGRSTLWGGYGQDSDTLQGGSGADTFFFGSGEGTDTITDYDAQKDTIDIYTNNISYGFVMGSDAVFHTPDSVLTLKDAAGGRVNIVYQNGTNYNIWLGLEKDNTIQYDSSLNYYYGAKNHKDTLTIAGDAAIWMNNSTSTTYENIDNLDASSSTGSVILAGSTGSNLIIGSQGRSTLWGGYGQTSDTIMEP